MSLKSWMDELMKDSSVEGLLLIDNNTGFSLGHRGIAKNTDAPDIKWLLENNSSPESPDFLTVAHKNSIVYISRDKNLITAIYRPICGSDSGNSSSSLSELHSNTESSQLKSDEIS